MSQVLTEGTNLNVALETTLGTLPSAGWLNLQPNSYGNIGPQYKKVARTPISKNRQLQKPILVDEDSLVPFQADITKDLLDQFVSGIFMSTTKHSGGTGLAYFRPTAVTGPATNAWTVAASGALASGILVYGSGMLNAANNGLHALTAGSTATSIKTADALVTETPPANATLEVAGVRGASGDITMDANGNLTATTLNFTTLGLNVGQWIWVGGNTATGGANSFATLAYRGFARIKAIAAGLLTLERRSWTVGSADTGAAKLIDIYFSRWSRNVAIDHADYLTPSYSFEVTYPNLGAGPVAEYEYPLGNMLDTFVWNLPLTTKATCDLSFVGTVSNDPTTSRQAGASTALAPLKNVAVSTATDLVRLRMSNADETGISTDFVDLKITMKNNVSPEKELGRLGANIINVGRFEVSIDATVIFTSDQVIVGVHDNRTISLDVAMRNGDFAALIDVASATIDAADRSFQTNKSVEIKSKVSGFQDANLGYTASLSIFPFLPAS